MPSILQDALTKAFEPDFTLELKSVSSENSLFLEHRLLDMLDEIGYEYAASTTGTVLFIKKPKEKRNAKRTRPT